MCQIMDLKKNVIKKKKNLFPSGNLELLKVRSKLSKCNKYAFLPHFLESIIFQQNKKAVLSQMF